MSGDRCRVRGVHGVKRRWLGPTMRHGLRRPSAAWFQVSGAVDRNELLGTLASTIYLALNAGTCRTLCAVPGRGRYATFFRTNVELVPAVLVFPDEPSGNDVLDRYVWLGPPHPRLTAPYTKVERAGRSVSLTGPTEVYELTSHDIAEAEMVADGATAAPGWWEDRRPLHKVPKTPPAAIMAPRAVATKLAYFCTVLSERVMHTMGWGM